MACVVAAGPRPHALPHAEVKCGGQSHTRSTPSAAAQCAVQYLRVPAPQWKMMSWASGGQVRMSLRHRTRHLPDGRRLLSTEPRGDPLIELPRIEDVKLFPLIRERLDAHGDGLLHDRRHSGVILLESKRGNRCL
jgi:hypothetical protein